MEPTRNRRMRARQRITYFGQDLQPGDHFYATDIDAGYLISGKRAEDTQPETSPTDATVEQKRQSVSRGSRITPSIVRQMKETGS